MLLEEVKISEVFDFRICPVPKTENSEISESILLLQTLTAVVT